MHNQPSNGKVQVPSGAMPTDPVLLFDRQANSFDKSAALLTISEVAQILNISSSGVRRLQQRRLIPFVKVGGSIRFLASDVATYVGKMRVEAVS